MTKQSVSQMLEIPVNQMSISKMSVGECLFANYLLCLMSIDCTSEFPFSQVPFGQISVSQMSFCQLSDDQISVRQLPVGQMSVSPI
jgi:hypothetical protein